MLPRLAVLLAAAAAAVARAVPAAGSSNSRYSLPDYDYHATNQRDYSELQREREYPQNRVHTYLTMQKCVEACLVECTYNTVYLEVGMQTMYSCSQLKPPKTLKGSSFYLSLFVIGVIVVGILALLTLCFCCSYCCRHPSSAESSRGSSKQALAHNEDGEFKEYLNGNGMSSSMSAPPSAASSHHAAAAAAAAHHPLNGHHHLNGHGTPSHDDGIGLMKRDHQQRDFARRTRPVPQIV